MIELMRQVVARFVDEASFAPQGPWPLLVVDQAGSWFRADMDEDEEFERCVGRNLAERNVSRWAFGVQAVLAEDDDHVYLRAYDARLPLQPGEQEIIWLLAANLEHGLEVGRVAVTRREETVRLGDLEVMVGEHQALDTAPGFALLRAVLGAEVS